VIISLNYINKFIFVMDIRCVFFEVGTTFLNVIYMKLMLQRVKGGTLD
jgi:hypothetical protein